MVAPVVVPAAVRAVDQAAVRAVVPAAVPAVVMVAATRPADMSIRRTMWGATIRTGLRRRHPPTGHRLMDHQYLALMSRRLHRKASPRHRLYRRLQRASFPHRLPRLCHRSLLRHTFAIQGTSPIGHPAVRSRCRVTRSTRTAVARGLWYMCRKVPKFLSTITR